MYWCGASVTAGVNVGSPRTVRTPANEDAISGAVISAHNITRELGPTPIKFIHVTETTSLFSDGRTPRKRSSRITFSGYRQHVYARGSTQRRFWAPDNPHALHDQGYQVHFSVSVSTRIAGGIVVDPPPPPAILATWQALKCSTRAAWRCASRWLQQDGRCVTVVERDVSREMNLMSRADCRDTLRSTSVLPFPRLLKISW
jgi:hypothetical protein